MSITVVILSTAVTSSLVASLVTFFLKQAFDRQLEYHFNTRLEQLKAELATQSELKQKFTDRRLELYPKIVESIYRTRNLLREICQNNSASIDQNLIFVRLAKDYAELIYQARLDLERDNLFNAVHSLKDQIVIAENLSLDLIHLMTQKHVDAGKINKTSVQLKNVYSHIERQHRKTINRLTKLTEI
jgi:L-cystine uptake protein TcyP (sodium:dicarboxylate symporter family)